MGDHRNMQNLTVKLWLWGQTHPCLVEGFRLLLLGDAVPVVPVRSGYIAIVALFLSQLTGILTMNLYPFIAP